MIYYSSKGNIKNIDASRENSPDYIEEAIKAGYKVQIDIRLMSDNNFWLGEEEAKYKIEDSFLIKNAKNLLIHCRNISSIYTIQEIEVQSKNLNYFFHATDNVAITSKKMIAIFYGKKPIGENSIVMFPEENDFQKNELIKSSAICSNSIEFYKKLIENENSGIN